MSLLKQDTIRKGWVNKLLEFKPEREFDVRDNKKYEIEAICDSKVYAKEAIGQLPGLYYLISWKGYIEEKSTWKLASIVMYLYKMINTFHKNYLEKFIATLPSIDFALPMAKPITKLTVKSPTETK